MSINISVPEQHNDLRPKIVIFGVGGAGCNAVNNMITANLDGVEFWVANTDAQSLSSSSAPHAQRIQLGMHCTKGLGAGSDPGVGFAAAEESADEIRAAISGCHMLFITAGMGGGTGTGAAPFIAKIAKEENVLVVGVVTKPFHFEGARRMKVADAGLEEVEKYVDTIIIIPNQNLFRVVNEKTTLMEAFKIADDVLHSGVRSITDLITMPGLINLDFADIKTIMQSMGKAMMGTGDAEGEGRAVRAAEAAISNPLLDNSSMKGARGVLINITGGLDMTLFEVDEAANRIKEEISDQPNVHIIFGSAFNKDLQGILRVSVVATGIEPKRVAKEEIAEQNEDNNSTISAIRELLNDQKLQPLNTSMEANGFESDEQDAFVLPKAASPDDITIDDAKLDRTTSKQRRSEAPIQSSQDMPTETAAARRDNLFEIPAFLRRKK